MDWSKIIQILAASVVCGVFGTATRNAMDILKITEHPKFFAIPFFRRKFIFQHIPFAYRRHLIGVVTAFVAIVTLGYELDVLHEAVIGLIATMSGSGFLEKHLEGNNSHGAIAKHFSDAVDYELESLAAEIEESTAFKEVASGNDTVNNVGNNVTISEQEIHNG